MAHFIDDVLQDLAGAVGVFLVGHVDADGGIAGTAAGIGERRHRAEGNDVHRAVGGAQADGADRDVLDRARQSRHRDVVADLDGVLEQQKQAGDEVLHQLLRAEADGNADDAGAGQQGCDVDADFAQRGQTDHGHDQAQQRRPQHRLKGAQPRRARVMAVARQRIHLAVHQRVGDFPDRRRRKCGDADRHHRRQQPAADLAAIEPDDGVDTPNLQQGHEADEGNDGSDDPAQQRQIAVGAALQSGEALQDLRADAEAAIDQAQHHDAGQPGNQYDRDGADEILQQQRVAVVDIERPHRPQREVECDRQIMPQPGETIARTGSGTLAAGRRTNGMSNGPAALQDDDDDKEMHDQHHQAQQRRVAGAMQAEQQRHVRKSDARHGDGDDAPRPDLDIDRGLGADTEQTERPRQGPHHADQPARQRVGIHHREDHEAGGGEIADPGPQQHRGDADEDHYRKQLGVRPPR